MPDENDVHENAGEARRDRNGSNGKVVELKAGQKAKPKRQERPPAEAPRTWPAPEVEAVAARLINGKYPHMSVLRGARIAFLFTNSEREGDPRNVAKVTRFSSTYSFLYEDGAVPQFVMRVSKPQWDRIAEELQPQCVYSYLLQMGTDSNGRWRIEKPDVFGFLAELEVWKGLPKWWNEGFAKARQLGLFDGIASVELASETRGKEAAHR